MCDEAGAGPVMVAGQSYGGLAVLERLCAVIFPSIVRSPSLRPCGGEESNEELAKGR